MSIPLVEIIHRRNNEREKKNFLWKKNEKSKKNKIRRYNEKKYFGSNGYFDFWS